MIDFEEEAVRSFEKDKEQLIRFPAGAVEREGIFFLPENAHGLVILAQGIEDATHGPRQRALALAEAARQQRLATLVVDLFSREEVELDRLTGYFQHNTDIMQQRIIGIADWFQEQPATETLSIGYFGMDEAGAAALIAAAERPDIVAAVVSTGGNVDLARDYLPRVLAPTLLLAGEKDTAATERCQEALNLLQGNKRFVQIAGARSLSTEQVGRDDLIRQASEWFSQRLITIM